MMGTKVTFDTVKSIGLLLPEVEVSTAYGAPSLKLRGQLMTCPALNKSAEPDSIVVKVSFDQRDDLLREAPDIYYVTDHYVNYPSVLVRLSRIEPDALKDLLGMAWSFVTKESSRGKRTVPKKGVSRRRTKGSALLSRMD